ncbi:iron chelate uptake ABC transporter, FeCT family, permease protein [Hallella bergensis DSM 17361]|uniref:Iron chelate uptake ABC transporter, FeCT family, permease protein n=2 Tax=Hallella bergensis TaxID=242750 RepID=D1PY25_9BACT|nr:iron chelate uptake ABC transporter, FeCT family, permease protein [Hallella bergensis DSM 17361]
MIMMKTRLLYFVLSLAIVFLCGVGLVHGSVDIPLHEIWNVIFGNDVQKESWRFIIIENRLPQVITALLAGGALTVSGLLLQTAFRNPLAAPDIFGVTSGAALAVALLTLAPAVSASYMVSGLSSVTAAFIGAVAVTTLIWTVGKMVHNHVMLIIIGIMIGYLASSAITLLNFFATKEGVKSFAVWGMGNFGNVSMNQMPFFATVTLLATSATLLLIKPLNALLMGENYAENLGINVHRVRNILLVVTGLLTAIVTAFCGPIAFIALAVPHIARLLLQTSDHRHLLPVTILTGCVVALLCNVLTTLPGESGILPLNAVTPIIGAPIIIYVIIKE